MKRDCRPFLCLAGKEASGGLTDTQARFGDASPNGAVADAPAAVSLSSGGFSIVSGGTTLGVSDTEDAEALTGAEGAHGMRGMRGERGVVGDAVSIFLTRNMHLTFFVSFEADSGVSKHALREPEGYQITLQCNHSRPNSFQNIFTTAHLSSASVILLAEICELY